MRLNFKGEGGNEPEMIAQQKHRYTLEEYLELDHNSEEKIEFWDGSIWTMSGASIAHNTIVANVITKLSNRLEVGGCRVFPSDTRIYVPGYPPYRYPDVSALCGKLEIKSVGNQEMLANPQLLIEVLSDSTEAFDRGDKFGYYKSIPSFTEYLLISQKRAFISQFTKQSENGWLNLEYIGLEAALKLDFTDCNLELSEIYRDVTFPVEPFKVIERND